MYWNIVRVFAVLTLAGSLACAWGATPAIGMVSAGGSFQVDGARVTGNATLFEGAVIETNRAPSELQWFHGGRMILGADSRGRVCRDRLVLERGQGQIAGSTNYPIEAATLRVLAAQPDSTALVSLDGPRQLHVSALAGSVRVFNPEGVLVANIATGKTLEMETQVAGAAAPSTLTGTVLQRDGHFLLTDETTGVTVELKGENLGAAVGKRVEVTGTIDTSARPLAGASQTILVLEYKVQVPTLGHAASGVARHKKAIFAGVAVAAATGGGLAIGLTREDKTPISR